MEKLKKIISLCKASVNITINNHKDSYRTVEQYIGDRLLIDDEILDDIGSEVYDEMVKRDTIIEIQVYPNTPIGSYQVYHYDIDKAMDLILECLE